MGSGLKERDPSLDPARATFEKSIVARTRIPEGAVLEPEMLTTKRPGNGISALRIADVVGRTAARELEPDHQLEEADLV
jgi:N,N'-diacetyllegionaminate synthase